MLQVLASLVAPGMVAPGIGCGRGRDRLLFSGIPDADKTELAARYAEVSSYLTKALSRAVEYVHVPDYTAAVVALAAHKIDFAWLGGVTAVQADDQTPSGVHFVATRRSDLQFKSYFIANQKWVDRGDVVARAERLPQKLVDLKSLAPLLARGTFSFGAKSSTSGHVMPRWFLTSGIVGLDPATAFAAPPSYQRKGGHSATLQAVATGAVDFGVVNFAAWEAADEATKTAAPVIFVTPQYVDYCLVAHGSLGRRTVTALRDALVGLDAGDPEQAGVLAAFGAKEFVPAQREAWEGIRQVLDKLEASGELQ